MHLCITRAIQRLAEIPKDDLFLLAGTVLLMVGMGISIAAWCGWMGWEAMLLGLGVSWVGLVLGHEVVSDDHFW